MYEESSSILSIHNQIIHRVTLHAQVEECTLNFALRRLTILVKSRVKGAADRLGLSPADVLSGIDFEGRVDGLHVELSQVAPVRVAN